MNNNKNVIIAMVISAVLVGGLVFSANFRNADTNDQLLTDDQGEPQTLLNGPLSPEEQLVSNPEVVNIMNPTAIITTNHGVIELELFQDQMPVTVGNFISLAESDFYDGLKFHRIIDGFMIQGGDPNTRSDNELTYGTGGSDNIQDEFVSGELLTNTRGTIAMANTGEPNSGSSQWFINLADNVALDFDNDQQPDSKHPVFGRVTKGMDVVDEIGKVETNRSGLPLNPVIIESITISAGQ